MNVSWRESTETVVIAPFFGRSRPASPLHLVVAMRVTRAIFLLLLLVLLPATVPAATFDQPITVDQIAALSRAGVSDAVIIAMIERDQPIFTIDAAEIVRLREDGLSEQLIIAMLASDNRPWEEVPLSPAPPPPSVSPILPVVPYLIAVPSFWVIVPGPVATAPPATRGIFFSRPTTGIFFAPSAAPSPPSR